MVRFDLLTRATGAHQTSGAQHRQRDQSIAGPGDRFERGGGLDRLAGDRDHFEQASRGRGKLRDAGEQHLLQRDAVGARVARQLGDEERIAIRFPRDPACERGVWRREQRARQALRLSGEKRTDANLADVGP